MRYKNILFSSVLLLTAIYLGFTNLNPNGSKTRRLNANHNPYTPVSYQAYGTAVYVDSFNGDNSMIGIRSRGYLPSNQSQPPGSTEWFQGQIDVFTAFNGPGNGYIAANFNNTGTNGNIDNWLVFPRINGGIYSGDSLYFWARSTDYNSPNFPDSIRVMYSVNDSVPSGSWTELGRFQVPNPDTGASNNGYTLYGFRAPATGINGRFAIRYCVVDGGQNGSNSDYIGIDAASIIRTSIGISEINSKVPGEYYLSQNYPNPFNPSTKINFALPKSGFVSLRVFDMLGREISALVNQILKEGNYSVDFNGKNLSSGVYLYRLTADNFSSVKKMLMIK